MWQPMDMLKPILSTIIFGLIGILLTLAGFKLFDWITPGINVEHELAEKHNIAVAIVVAAIIVGISVLMAAVVSS